MKQNQSCIGVGVTEALRLRVSVAALVSVLFDHPEDGRVMLALEHIATLRQVEGRPEITVRAKSLGGGVRLTDPQALQELIGHFHYDSEQSCRENDFRILIRPSSWEKVKKICLAHLEETQKNILDSSPERELTEEFEDTLHVKVTPDKYHLKRRGMIVEDRPLKTDNVRAAGFSTVRIYYVFEARIKAPELISLMLASSRRYSAEVLQKMAWKDARQGGKGRANAILTLSFDDLKNMYHALPADQRGRPVQLGEHQLDGNVQAIII
jgi:hypothetical protein